MELRDYLRILIRRGWIVVLIAAVAATSAFAFSKLFVTREYRSEVLLSVLPTRAADWGSGQGAKGMLNNFAEQIRQNDEIAAVAADRLKLDLPPDALKSRIQVDPDELNLTLKIRATDADPIIAKRIAQTFAQVFVEARTAANLEMDQRDRIIATIMVNARDGEQFRPQTKVNTAAGGVFGLLIGLLLVFVLEYAAAGTVIDARDVERLGTTVLGSIPAAEASSGGRRLSEKSREPRSAPARPAA